MVNDFMDVAPYRLSGVVYGTLLNDCNSLLNLGNAVSEAPYQSAPKAPVLYIKPRNTLARSGVSIALPEQARDFCVGGALGLVIGRTACKLDEADALSYVSGYAVVGDVSVPHDSFYRPSVRLNACDGSCVIGDVVGAIRITNPDRLSVRYVVDGEVVATGNTADMVRGAARLLCDVTEFMTLSPGDVLLLGVTFGAPKVGAGAHVMIEIESVGGVEVIIQGAKP